MNKRQQTSISDTKPVKRPRVVKRIEILEDGWPKYGLLRCDQIIAPGGPLPLSKSQFWLLIKQHNLVALKLSPRVTAFWVHDLRRIFFGVAPLRETAAPLHQDYDDAQPLAVAQRSIADDGPHSPQ